MRFIYYLKLIVLLLHCTHSYPLETSWNNMFITEYPVECCIIGATTMLAVGILSYNYYYNHIINYEHIIEDCRLMYKNIYQDIQKYYNFYYSDVQISNWDLKEIIVDNKLTSYPFMAYYTSLIKSTCHLRNHLTTLHKQLIKIGTYRKQLSTHKPSETRVSLQEMFRQLEMKGKQLKEYTVKTITLIIILKNRIQLFREYHNDCHNWSQTIQRTKAIP